MSAAVGSIKLTAGQARMVAVALKVVAVMCILRGQSSEGPPRFELAAEFERLAGRIDVTEQMATAIDKVCDAS